MPSFSSIKLVCDRLRFPAVLLDGVGLSLFPVTWFQFERYLAEPTGEGNAWYREVQLELGDARGSWRTFQEGNRETVFMNGLRPAETSGFIQWMNRGPATPLRWSVPDVETWRHVGSELLKLPFDDRARRQLAQVDLNVAVRTLIERIDRQTRPDTWGELALFVGNVFERVHDRAGDVLLGAPRPEKLANIFDPFIDKPVRYFGEGRDRLAGLRLKCTRET